MPEPTTDLTSAPAVAPADPQRLPVAGSRRVRNACQRGMVTAEYAVGILAAIALALVLVKVFNNNQFFTVMLAQVTKLIGQIGATIK